jgi:hypothetical protein
MAIAIAERLAEIESRPLKRCKCGHPFDLVRSMLNVRSGKTVRMFECKGCGERTWDE